jgi:thioredoxin
MKKTLILFIFAVITFACGNNNQAQQSAGANSGGATVENVDVKKFKELCDAGNGIILDVRTPDETARGHIAGASLVNIYDKDFADKINLMNKNKEIYVYCKVGGRSSQAAQILAENGFKKVYNLNGGIMAWEASNFPVEKSANAPDEKIAQMSIEDFKKMIAGEKAVLVDFHTVWCAPCKKMAPVIDEIEGEMGDKAVVKRVDLDKSKEVSKAYQITGVPVFVIFKNGEEKWRHFGIISKEDIKKELEKFL